MQLVKAWSYSAWALYTLCPFKYKCAKIDKLPDPGGPAMKRGNDIHVATAAYITHKSDTLPQEVLQHARIVTLVQELRAVEPDYKQVEQQWGFTREWKTTGWFSADTWFRNVLDAGVMYDDMTYEDIDWKTGKRYGSNADQMETQALSVMFKYPPVRHVTTRLAYIDSGEEEFAEFPIADRDKLRAKWETKIVPMFSDVVFAPRPNDKCKWCAFSKSKSGPCRFG